MKNNQIIITAIVVVIAAAIGGYYVMQNRSNSQTTGADTSTMREVSEGNNVSLKELMNLGTNQQCTFNYSGEHGSTEGTSYITNGKVRTDFSGTNPEGATYTGGMIMDTEYIYSWTSEMEQGIKMPVTDSMEEEAQQAQENPDEYRNQYIDPDAEVDYNCTAWSVDNSMFVPPSDVTFLDISQQMEMYDSMMQESTDVMEQSQSEDMQSACSACESLTGDAATACKQALSC